MQYLAVATDPGGAANAAPIAALLGDACEAIASAGTAEYFERQRVAHLTLVQPDDGVGALFDRCRPDAILCGTTRYVSPDRRAIAEARRRHIPSVVVLDEWYLYAYRFQDDAGDFAFLPDVICVPDDLARHEAVAEGIPPARLEITGSPALAELYDRLDGYSRHPPALPSAVHGTPRPRVLFLSETHRADFGDEGTSGGPLGSFLGYTEQTVARELAAVVAAIGSPCTVVEKLHPATVDTDGPSPGLAPGQVWARVAHAPLSPLLWHADLVVGMRSIALLEGALAGRPTLSYQPGLRRPYGPSTAERLGYVDRADTRARLTAWLTDNWQGTAAPPKARPPFASASSTERVRDIVVRLASAHVAQGMSQ
jgi:hypothetical protein